MRTVLFVCTGNTCRSPMAEAIARQALLSDPALFGGDQDIFIASAGISALDGMPTTHETVDALRRKGIDFDGRSKRLTEQMIRKASYVITMTAAHQASARRLVPDSPEDQAKVVVLDPTGAVDDPIGMGQREYDALAERLSRLIPARLKQLLAPEGESSSIESAAPPSKRPPASRKGRT